MSTKRTGADRAASYRNRNASLALPETRDVDYALVAALRDRLKHRGVKRVSDLDALEADDDLRLLVARVLRVLRDRRFSVGEQPEAYRRVCKRLGLDS